MLCGAIRQVAKVAPLIEKIDKLPMDVLKNGLLQYVWGKDLKDIELATFRTLYGWMLATVTLARLKDAVWLGHLGRRKQKRP